MLLMINGALYAQVNSVSITKNQDLQFGGMIVPPNQSGTVTISTSGLRTASGGIYLLSSSYSQANFSVLVKKRDTVIKITLPSTATIYSGTHSMVVTDFISNPADHFTALSAWYTQSLDVGAKLNIGINQAYGSYSGTFNVTVTIQ